MSKKPATVALTLAMGLTMTLSACGQTEGPADTQTPAVTPQEISAESPSQSAEETQTDAETGAASGEPTESTEDGGGSETEATGEAGGEGQASDEPSGEDEDADDGEEEGDDKDEVDNSASSPTEAVQTYTDALVSGDVESAVSLLSEESQVIVGDDLAGEPWLSAMVDDLSQSPPDATSWTAYPAWAGAGTGEDVQVVLVRGEGSDGERFAYGWGARLVNDQWVVDQDRIDTSTGAPIVEFLNPTWEKIVDPNAPLSFEVSTADGAPADVTMRYNGHDEPRELVEEQGDGAVIYSESEVNFGMPGYDSMLVTTHLGDNPMVRAHTTTFLVE